MNRLSGNSRSEIRRTRFSILAIGFIALVGWAVSSPTSADNAAFSFGQSKERTGRGSFPHDQKEHIKVVCADCHLSGKEKPKNTDQPMAKDFPHTACIRCHNFAAEFFKSAFGGQSRFCGICHEPRPISRADKALRPGVLPRPQVSDFDDAFSHKAHRKQLPADLRIAPINNPPYGAQFNPGSSPRCTDCHAQVKSPRSQRDREVEASLRRQGLSNNQFWATYEFKTEKGHPSCFVCHGGTATEPRRVSAETFPYSNDCKVCHELQPNGATRRPILFGKIPDFYHDDHDLDIRPKKRSDFPLPTAPDRLCSECHKPIDQVDGLRAIRLPEAGYCNTCHISRRPGLPDKLSDEVLNKLSR